MGCHVTVYNHISSPPLVFMPMRIEESLALKGGWFCQYSSQSVVEIVATVNSPLTSLDSSSMPLLRGMFAVDCQKVLHATVYGTHQ